MCEDVEEEEEEEEKKRRKKKQTKVKKKKKQNVKDKIIVEGLQSRLACIMFHLNWW